MAFSPNGRTVASAIYLKNQVKLFEAVTGTEVASLEATFSSHPMMIAFSPDGRYLGVNSDKMVVLVDLPATIVGNKAANTKELPALWNELASPNPATVYRAHWRMVRAGNRAVGFLGAKMQPVVKPDADRLQSLIKDLNSDRFVTRMNAARELEKIGQAAIPALQNALACDATPETRRRIAALLAGCRDARRERAMDVLETIGDADARRLLQRLAEGMPEAPLTQDAEKALRRLQCRQ